MGNIRSAFQNRTGVLGVQELLGPTKSDAQQLLRYLAEDTGLMCEVMPVRGKRAIPALASQAPGASAHRFHVGLLWTSNIEPVPGTFRAYEGSSDFWHGLAMADFQAGGPVPARGVAGSAVSGAEEHPRVGGEDLRTLPPLTTSSGRPPRRRGGRSGPRGPGPAGRNTPASAGRTM